MLEVDIRHKQGAFMLEAAFHAGAGLTALVGASGAGKTTLANIAAGLIHPAEGHIRFGEKTWFDSARGIYVPPGRRRIGYVFQDGRLFPHLTVQQNLDYSRRFQRVKPDVAADRKVIDVLGIGHLLDRRPAGLSGGEKSRVAIGRALFSAPELLIMDEPLSALDPARKTEIMPHLEYIRDETGIPVLYVSHAMQEVARLATRVISVADGRIAAEGTPAEVLSGHVPPSPEIVPGTFLEATVKAHLETDDLTVAESRAGTLYLKRGAAEPGDRVRVHIPANDIILALDEPGNLSTLNRLTGNIARIEQNSGSVWVTVDCGGEMVLTHVTQRSAALLDLKPGLPVHLLFKSVTISTQGLFRQHS